MSNVPAEFTEPALSVGRGQGRAQGLPRGQGRAQGRRKAGQVRVQHTRWKSLLSSCIQKRGGGARSRRSFSSQRWLERRTDRPRGSCNPCDVRGPVTASVGSARTVVALPSVSALRVEHVPRSPRCASSPLALGLHVTCPAGRGCRSENLSVAAPKPLLTKADCNWSVGGPSPERTPFKTFDVS